MAKKKGKTISVDMTGVEVGGKKIPEGDYVVEVAEVSSEESEAGKPYLSWQLKIVEGKLKGGKLYHITSLQPQALFNLRNLLESLGIEVPDGALKLDLDSVIGLQCGVTVEHEEYQGKKRNRVVDVYSLDGDSDSDDEGDDEDEEEEGSEEYTEDDLNEMSDEDLIEVAEGLEVEIVYSNKKKKKLDKKAIIAAILEAQESSDDEEEEEGDDDSDDDGGEELSEEDFEDMSDDDVKAKAEEYDVEPVAKKKGKKQVFDREATIAAILEAAGESDDEEEDELTEEELEELSDEDLIEKAAEYDVTPVKKKKKLDRKATIEAILEAADI